MTSTEQRAATVLPTPRTGAADDALRAAGTDPEWWRRSGGRPTSHYWDVATARWCTR